MRKRTKKRVNKWVQKAHLRKGALHRKLGIPEGQNIPVTLLKRAAKVVGILGQEARFALTARKFRHRKAKHKKTR